MRRKIKFHLPETFNVDVRYPEINSISRNIGNGLPTYTFNFTCSAEQGVKILKQIMKQRPLTP